MSEFVAKTETVSNPTVTDFQLQTLVLLVGLGDEERLLCPV